MTPLNELALIAFPIRELFQDKIGEFDLIILDRFQNRGTAAARSICATSPTTCAAAAPCCSRSGPEFAGLGSLSATAARQRAAGPRGGGPTARWSRARSGRSSPRSARAIRSPPTCRAGSRSGPPDWGAWYRRIEPADPTRRGADERAGRRAAAAARPRRPGPRRHAAVRPDLALVARPPGRRPAGRAAAPHRALADEGAGAGGGGAAPPRIDQGQHDRRAPLHRRRPAAAASPSPIPTAPGRPSRCTKPVAGPRHRRGRRRRTPGVWQASDGTRTAFAAAAVRQSAGDRRPARHRHAYWRRIVRASGGSTHFLDPAGAPELAPHRAGRASKSGLSAGSACAAATTILSPASPPSR